MGSPISSILEEIFLQELQKKFYPTIIKIDIYSTPLGMSMMS
jgi:hypothetical protein